jgi:hypothetical protein
MHFSFSNSLLHGVVLTGLDERSLTKGTRLGCIALKHACREHLQSVNEVAVMVYISWCSLVHKRSKARSMQAEVYCCRDYCVPGRIAAFGLSPGTTLTRASNHRETKQDYSHIHSQCPYSLAVSAGWRRLRLLPHPTPGILLPRYIYMALGSVKADLVLLLPILFTSSGARSLSGPKGA